jgi:hypothetical protein
MMFGRILGFFIAISIAAAFVYGAKHVYQDMPLDEAVTRGVGNAILGTFTYAWGYYTCTRDTIKELNW